MKCNNCGVTVNSPSKYCPICSNKLKHKGTNTIYPKIKRKSNMYLKVLLFISLLITLVVGYIDYEINKKITFSAYVGLALLSNYITIVYIFRSYKDIFKLFGRYGLILNIILFIWYMYTKQIFITNYIIPGLCIIELLFIDIFLFIFKRKHIRKYLGVLISNVVVAFVPLILIALKMIDFNYVAHVAMILSIINILILVIFDFSDLKEEVIMFFNY
ncbi:MAG: hypothetical protein IJS56_06695 [Bacilli bacterium]|nr:hypothetical protein [Bacilli bacterium]